MSPLTRKLLILAGAFFALWLGTKLVMPLVLPFLAGGAVALLAEPLVRLGVRQLKLPRAIAAGFGVAATLLMLMGFLFLLGALAVREVGQLASMVPDLQDTASRGMIVLQDWLVSAADHTPEGVRPLVTQTVLNVFDDGKFLLPIFTMGKYFERDGKRLLPLAIQVHHAVCDGYHVGLFVETLQDQINRFEK